LKGSESRFGFRCNADPLVNLLDLHNHEQLAQQQNKWTDLPQKNCVTTAKTSSIPPPPKKKEKENGKKAGLFPQREYSSLFHR